MLAPAFSITSQGDLFAELVSALLKQLHPEAAVTFSPCEHGTMGPGVRVGLNTSERWMFVSTRIGPSDEAVEALSKGACGVLTLDSKPEEFTQAIDALVSGTGSYVPWDVVQWMAGATLRGSGDPADAPVKLTQREREVLRLVAMGFSNAEIARSLTISINTVRTHLHALSVKLDANSRTRVLANARALGLPEAMERAAADRQSA